MNLTPRSLPRGLFAALISVLVVQVSLEAQSRVIRQAQQANAEESDRPAPQINRQRESRESVSRPEPRSEPRPERRPESRPEPPSRPSRTESAPPVSQIQERRSSAPSAPSRPEVSQPRDNRRNEENGRNDRGRVETNRNRNDSPGDTPRRPDIQRPDTSNSDRDRARRQETERTREREQRNDVDRNSNRSGEVREQQLRREWGGNSPAKPKPPTQVDRNKEREREKDRERAERHERERRDSRRDGPGSLHGRPSRTTPVWIHRHGDDRLEKQRRELWRRHQEERTRRWSGGHVNHWHGYGWNSRHHLGIRWYDPFYHDWIFWGGSYYYWRGVRRGSWGMGSLWDDAWDDKDIGEAAYSEVSGMTCFPPTLPPLGTPPPPMDLTPLLGESAGLQDYVTEFFYAPLSAQLLQGPLSGSTATALERYRNAREAEVDALRSALDTLAFRPDDAAIADFDAFSDSQVARLRILEESAEALRHDLAAAPSERSTLRSAGWSVYREYYRLLGVSDLDAVGQWLLDALALRAAAYFQDGLSLYQRELLVEASRDLRLKAYEARGGMNVEARAPHAYALSPLGVQVVLGPRVPDELPALYRGYAQRKQVLVEELVARLRLYDQDTEPRRREALEAYAAQRAVDYLELEQAADAVRACLAENPSLVLEDEGTSALPESLHSQMASLVGARADLLAEFRDQYRLLTLNLPAGTLRIKTQSGQDARFDRIAEFVFVPDRTTSSSNRRRIQAELAVINENLAARQRMLDVRESDLRAALEAWRRTSQAPVASYTLDRLFELLQERELQRRTYKDQALYREAILHPGLRIEQRRLLLGEALRQMQLSLPGPE